MTRATDAARSIEPTLSPAEALTERTGKAVAYVMAKHAATDLASFIDALDLPDDDPVRMAVRLEDGTEVFMLALSYSAAYVWGLCVFSVKHLDDAGKMFRRADVQQELRASAARVARNVLEK